MIEASSRIERRSPSGAISRLRSSRGTIETPRAAAACSIDSSPRASVPATSVVSYPREARPSVR